LNGEKEREPIGVPKRSSLVSFRESLEGNFWLDLEDELNAWLGDVHIMLEDPDGMLTEKELNRLGGNAEAIRRFLKMPQVMIENVESDREEDENE